MRVASHFLVASGPLFLLALAATPAVAQASASFDVSVQSPTTPQDAGNVTTVLFTLVRHCSAMASVLPEQVVDIAVHGNAADARATGPGQVVFPEQVCATESEESEDIQYQVRTPANASAGDVFVFEARFNPRPGSTPAVGGYGNEARVDFALEVADRGLDTVAMAEASGPDEELEAPALPSALLAIALLAAAFALRRR